MRNNKFILLAALMLGSFIAPIVEASGLAGHMGDLEIPHDASHEETFMLIDARFPDYKIAKELNGVVERVNQFNFRRPEGDRFRIFLVKISPQDDIINKLNGLELGGITPMEQLNHFEYMKGCVLCLNGLPQAQPVEPLTKENLNVLLNCKSIEICPNSIFIDLEFFRSPLVKICLQNIPPENREQALLDIMNICEKMFQMSGQYKDEILSTLGMTSDMIDRSLDMLVRHWVKANPPASLHDRTLEVGGLRIRTSNNPSRVYSQVRIDISSEEEKPLVSFLLFKITLMPVLRMIPSLEQCLV